MTKEETTRIIKVLYNTYPNFKSSTTKEEMQSMIDAWHFFLHDKSFQGMSLALMQYVGAHGSAFPPSVSQLIEEYNHITERVENEPIGEMEAWTMVYKAICRSGGDGYERAEKAYNSLPEILQKAVGTPANLRDMALDQKFNEGVERSNFLRNYKAQLERAKEEHRTLPQVKKLIEGNRKLQNLVSVFDTPQGAMLTDNDTEN